MTRGSGELSPPDRDTEGWWPEAQQTGDRRHQEDEWCAELCRLVGASDWLRGALEASCDLIGSPWCIAAGAVRSLVWNHLHGLPPCPDPEIDLVHFSPLAPVEFDAEVASTLTRRLPEFRWDVVNQVYAHRFAVKPGSTPFVSLEHAMACWPETATAVGVWLAPDGQLRVVAPLGLTDLFGLVLRPSPWLRDPQVFEQRLLAKRFRERWPLLRVV